MNKEKLEEVITIIIKVLEFFSVQKIKTVNERIHRDLSSIFYHSSYPPEDFCAFPKN
jgi:hypothetical protein